MQEAGETAGAKAQYTISAVNGVPLEELLMDSGVSHRSLKAALGQMTERPLELTLKAPPPPPKKKVAALVPQGEVPEILWTLQKCIGGIGI